VITDQAVGTAERPVRNEPTAPDPSDIADRLAHEPPVEGDHRPPPRSRGRVRADQAWGTNTPPPDTKLAPTTTWVEVDLGPVIAGLLDGTITRPTPTVGSRTDGVALFYPGRVNSLFGESGDAKTWIALHAAHQEIDRDQHVLFVDLEDDAAGVTGRLLDLGADPKRVATYFHYMSPEDPYGTDAEIAVGSMLDAYKPSLVIIDSAGEAMTVDQVKQNDDDHVSRWFRRVPRSIASRGPAVAILDHVTKASDTRGLYAIGSQRKRAAVTGAAYLVEAIQEFGKERAGRSKVTTAKDRCGTHVRGVKAAEFALDATQYPYVAALEVPTPSTDQEGEFRPTALMEKVSRYVEMTPGSSKSTIEKARLGKTDYVRQALELLIKEGYVDITVSGQSHRHTVVRPYRADDDETL
jgi:hypothetical protein